MEAGWFAAEKEYLKKAPVFPPCFGLAAQF
jgi:hypothetical protein